ncbi:MAG TPA: thioredoxin domain-containing protein [Gemmatimonadaceae bacterium]|nr:thioredoxin domain-containing protein [Gemmatimonadaceae bacterium]
MSNRLAEETSPYLRQHAHNPVDWYPWGDEALERARREDRPILLSVGYSACHWCHVMERESFEDDATAGLMNELFVNIKVDREERPDIDAIYMQAVQAMNGHGGWPMTVFLTPHLEPFWAGTYFPPLDRPGMPSFQRVLRAVADAFHSRRDDVQRVADSMRDMYAAGAQPTRGNGTLTPDIQGRAARSLLAAHDNRLGGFGDAPKFPQAMAMELLLQAWARDANPAALDAVRFTFLRMARGGIYDQVGGGFARYSVDAEWLVPHFEKMLYDNALLLRLGVHLWQASGDAEVRRVCDETIAWLEREMAAPDGGYCSALDADSEGEEGKFYVWSIDELRSVLATDADALIAYWGVTPEGNFEGHNILHVADGGGDVDANVVRRGKQKLLDARAKRERPGRDDKILAAWNGLAVRALAEAARAFADARLRDLAVRHGEFLFRAMVHADGTRVYRSHMRGTSRIAGFLDDHAAVALAALALYETTFDMRWLERARALADAVRRRFWDSDTAAFYDTASDHERLLTRPRDVTDNATPSGSSLTVELLLRLGDVLGDPDMVRQATYVLETIAEPMARYPLAFGHALTAADLAVHGAVELAIVGDPASGDFRALSDAATKRYVPSLVLAGGPEGRSDVSLLRDRVARDSRATAYLCRGYVCDEPVTDPARLAEQIDRAVRARAR